MGAVCVLVPIVKGKPSELYKDIFKATGKDRKLTNYLYSLSIQKEIKDKFDKKDFNSQDEIRSPKFLEKIGIEDIVRSKKLIEDKKEEIGAVDDRGHIIEYSTPEEILTKVLDFNNREKNLRATIAYTKGMFHIEVEPLNADNFDTNFTLEDNRIIKDSVLQYLNDKLKVNTVFTKPLLSTFVNVINAKSFYSTVKDIIFSSGADGYIYNEVTAKFIQELFKENPLMQRIVDKFGDFTPNVLAFMSGNRAYGLEPEALNNLNDYWKERIDIMLASIKEKLGSINLKDLNAFVEANRNSLNKNTTTTEGTEVKEVKKTLKELYRTYHIDKEIIENLNDKIESLQDAAERLFNLRIQQLEIKRTKKGKEVGDDNSLKELTKLMKAKDYTTAIITMLDDFQKEILLLNNEYNLIEDSYKMNPDSLDIINKISGAIRNGLMIAGAYKPAIKALINFDYLTDEEREELEGILPQIQDKATLLNDILENVENGARDKQFDVIYSFLKLYWGNEDTKEFDHEIYSLESMLRIAQKDINFFDRFVYSMNESNDAVLNLIYGAVKERNRERNKELNRGLYIVRQATDALYKSGNKSDFMYIRDDKGVPTGYLISPYDFKAFNRDKEAYIKSLKEQGLSKLSIDYKVDKWMKANTEKTDLFKEGFPQHILREMVHEIFGEKADPDEYIYSIRVPKRSKYYVQDIYNLSPAQRDYYYKMMALKMIMSSKNPTKETDFFQAIQVAADYTQLIKDSGGNPMQVYHAVKNMLTDAIQRREEDTDYGQDFDDVLELNGIKRVVSDLNGQELMRIPLFFTREIKDKTRLSTDFSKGMMAMMATSVQYMEMSKIIDALMLSKDWILGERKYAQTEGNRVANDIFTWGRDMVIKSVYKKNGYTEGLLTDFYEKSVYGKTKIDNGSFYLFGVKIDKNKIADWATTYTSTTGLVTNMLGAQANVLVGKLQMLIDGGAGEFYNLKDLGIGEYEYFKELAPFLLELNSNNKSSKMGLLLEKFDILEDFYGSLKSKGFHKSALGRMLSNANLFMLYGMGEHMLHAVTMYAVLNHTKVHDSKTNTDVSLREAYEVEKHDNNGKIVLDDRYQWIEKDKDGNITYRPITEKDEERVEKIITYANKTMHGAFSDIDKGMAHRYVVGRLIMNFRQWMPAHYGRRFMGLHYDQDLGEFRRGYYVSLWNYLKGCVEGLVKARPQIQTRWEELSEMDKYNMKRCIAEVAIFAMLTASNLSLGDYKDKRGNRAYRNLVYQIKRMLMETQASTPIPMPFSGQGAMGFVNNIVTTLNSPIASTNMINDIGALIDVTNLFSVVENGKDKGENLYWHKFKRVIPFYSQIVKQFNIDEEDYVFNVFKQSSSK